MMLGLVLFARAAAALSLAGWLRIGAPGWRESFREIAIYALVDGALALMVAALFAASRFRDGPLALVVTTFIDAIVRIGIGTSLLMVPTIAEVPMTVVSFFGVIGASAAFLGGIGIIAWAVAHHQRRREHSVAYEALFDPIPAIAIVSIVVGARLFIDPPATAVQLRSLVSAGAIAVAIGFVIAGAGSLAEGLRPRQPSAP